MTEQVPDSGYVAEDIRLHQRYVHLNTILQTLHEVSLLISKDLDQASFLDSLPSILVRSNGFKLAWVILFGPGKSVQSSSFAGEPGYPDIYAGYIRERQVPPCLVPMLAKTECQVIDPFPAFNPQASEPALSGYAYPLRIKHQTIGILVVAFEQRYLADAQQRQLFEEIALDVVTALYHDRTLLKLRESEEKFRVLFERSADAQLILKGDVFIECNDAMLRILGMSSKTELIGLTPWEVSPEIQPDGQVSKVKGLDLIKKAEDGNSERFEWTHVRLNGTEVPVEVSLTPVNYGSESFIHVALRDISDRKQAEKELYLANQRFRLIMANSPDIIWIRDMDLHLDYINPAVERIKGYTIAEIKNLDLSKSVTPDTYRMYLETIRQELAVDGQEGVDPARISRYESDEICRDGSMVHTESLASFLRDENGRPAGMLGVSRDISQQQRIFLELAKAKEQAEESDRLKSAFLANMSHEIRTPMNSILGFAELLGEEDLSSSERKQYIEIIQSGTNQLLSIISDIIDISKIQAGQVILHREKVNLDKVYEQMLVNFRLELARHGKDRIEFKRNCICHEFREDVYLDVARFNQIMGNLISNAIKFTDTGLIEVGCSWQGDLLRFFVRDTGKGISPAHQKIIFDRFRQVEESLTRNYTGTGLGLAICKGLVTLMGGEIGVISEAGRGSEFWFTVPVVS